MVHVVFSIVEVVSVLMMLMAMRMGMMVVRKMTRKSRIRVRIMLIQIALIEFLSLLWLLVEYGRQLACVGC